MPRFRRPHSFQRFSTAAKAAYAALVATQKYSDKNSSAAVSDGWREGLILDRTATETTALVLTLSCSLYRYFAALTNERGNIKVFLFEPGYGFNRLRVTRRKSRPHRRGRGRRFGFDRNDV